MSHFKKYLTLLKCTLRNLEIIELIRKTSEQNNTLLSKTVLCITLASPPQLLLDFLLITPLTSRRLHTMLSSGDGCFHKLTINRRIKSSFSFCANKAAETPQRNQLCISSIELKIVEALEQHYLLSSQTRALPRVESAEGRTNKEN